MNAIEKIQFARKVVTLFEINTLESDDLDTLLTKIRDVLLIPSSTTEWEIVRLAREIADELDNQSTNFQKLDSLYQKLYDEVTFLPFE